MTALLEAHGVSASLGGRQVVGSTDLALSAGELVCLIGPNGAGKTTLLRALAGLIPHRGTVRLQGTPMALVARSERARKLAYLPQSGAIGWPIPVADLVGLGRMPHGGSRGPLAAEDDAAVTRALTRTGLDGFERRVATELSGGEKARALLARALAVEADVLLADEPVASLDPRHQIAVMSALRAEARDGRAVVAVLHDLALAARYADRIVLMEEGRVVADGSPRSVLDAARIAAVFGIEAIADDCDGERLVVPWRLTAGGS